MKNSVALWLCGAALCFSSALHAQQNLTQPRASQAASVSQRIGLLDVTVNYSSPGVNKRTIWGSLVPYDQVWRCGANENTTVTFSRDAMVEGKFIAAGTYGLHMIPGKEQWMVIFSTDKDAWGSFAYNKNNDLFRVSVTPVETTFHEWLTYEFPDRQADHATLSLKWEKLEVPIRISINLKEQVLENMKTELTGLAQFSWQGWNQIANYCAANNIHLHEALGWVDRSINQNKNYNNLMTKSLVLRQMGRIDEAKQLAKEAMPLGTEQQVNTYGYQLMGLGQVDEALSVFQDNVKKNPKSWNVYDSLAEAYGNKGDKANAIKNYKKALEMAPENQKARIQGILDDLQK
ncbi:MAG: DUF2911 domain-containing protein [Flavobacteriales bacterium]|nr:DUF2911 domain-containing protein [Flavobacteriales bacterium]